MTERSRVVTGLPLTALRVGEVTRIHIPHVLRAERLVFSTQCCAALLGAYDDAGVRVETIQEGPWSYRFAPHREPVRTLLVVATEQGTVAGGMFGWELN